MLIAASLLSLGVRQHMLCGYLVMVITDSGMNQLLEALDQIVRYLTLTC